MGMQIPSFRRLQAAATTIAALFAAAAATRCPGDTLVVTSAADPVDAGTTAGTLRWAVTQANLQNTSNQTHRIEFAPALDGQMITLNSPLSPINAGRFGALGANNNTLLVNPTLTDVTISGKDAWRPFFVYSGNVVFSGLTIRDGLARGGHGGTSAGAGAGLGGSILVNNHATVTLFEVTLLDSLARGGNGGSFSIPQGTFIAGNLQSGGGGAGGNGNIDLTGGGGGLGGHGGAGGGGGVHAGSLTGAGGDDDDDGLRGGFTAGAPGGDVGVWDGGADGGGGAAQDMSDSGGGGGVGGANGGFTALGHGGFGGGGGAGGGNGGDYGGGGGGSGNGGHGGFGGGGGASGQDIGQPSTAAANGGFGGGGGGRAHQTQTPGGPGGLGGFGGGNAGSVPTAPTGTGGGGGAGFGGHFFVRDGGSLTLIDTIFTGGAVQGGPGGVGESGALIIDDAQPGLALGGGAFLGGNLGLHVSPGRTVTLADTIAGSSDPRAGPDADGSVTKTGEGTLVVTAANTYVGGTFVTGGTLLANNATGSATGPPSVRISNTGVLGGTGTVAGPVFVQTGGTLAPGADVGTLHSGNVNFGIAGTFAVQLDPSNSQGNGFSDLLDVTGTITISDNCNLDIELLSAPFPNQQFMIIANDTEFFEQLPGVFLPLPDPVAGRFRQQQGLIVDFNGTPYAFGINYAGGDFADDVVLVSLGPVPEPAGWLLATTVASASLLRRRARRGAIRTESAGR